MHFFWKPNTRKMLKVSKYSWKGMLNTSQDDDYTNQGMLKTTQDDTIT